MFKNCNVFCCLVIILATAGLEFASKASADEVLRLSPPESSQTSVPAEPFRFDSPSEQKLSLAPNPLLLDDAAPEKSWNDSPDGWHFRSHPGVWFAGLKGTVGKGQQKVSVDESFSDLFANLDLALATDFEVGKGPFSFLFNGMWQKFSADATGPGGRIKADTNLDFAIADGALAYKFFDKSFGDSEEFAPRLTLDALGGARWTYLSTDIKLKGGPFGGISKSQSVNWVDPYIGLRGTFDITKHLDVTVMGTIGGFDVGSRLTWSASAVLEYRFTRKFAAFIGYKVLSYDYDLNGFTWDVKMQGPLAGLTIRW